MEPSKVARPAGLPQTEFEFTLPRGYIDADGRLQRRGRMRLATARDEIMALQEPAVQDNPACLPVCLLSRVITRLGDLPGITPSVVEGLFAADMAYLEELYLRLNTHHTLVVGAVCPHCSSHFQLQVAPLEISGGGEYA